MTLESNPESSRETGDSETESDRERSEAGDSDERESRSGIQGAGTG
jgi:hypothetical protein